MSAPSLDFHSSDLEVGSHPQSDDGQTPKFDKNEIGQHCAFPWTPEPMYLNDEDLPVIVWDEFEDDPDRPRDLSPLSESARNALMDLDGIFSKADVAPRRIEIEQAWKAYHYRRGYQFLLHHEKGGWTFPQTGTGFGPGAQKKLATLYSTNVYGEKGEIIISALSRQVPNVEFFPADPKHPPDQSMADVADDLAAIWAKNNDLQSLLRDVASEFWDGDRALLWTCFWLNGEEYGYEDQEPPVVPEDEQSPPQEPTEGEGETDYEVANESPVNANAPRRPRGRVITKCMGKLDHQVPIYVNCRGEMGSIAICLDKDVSLAKAMFPWMKEKVQGGGDGTGETELDRIARENVKQAVPGQYVTGDSMNRHTVVKFRYLRPSTFFDANIKDDVRQELLEKFPDGALLAKAGLEFAFARNECMDSHTEVGHPFPGQGQNRRSLGESLLPIQDYINEMVMLTLDFAKRTIAKKWMDNEAFDVEALKTEKNIPGQIGPFQRQPGVPVDQLIFIEPTPTPQPYLLTWVQWIITSLSEQISGALPSLFGAPITGQVGSEGVGLQRDQAMQRMGSPWHAIQSMFAGAARQAAMLIAKCANKDIDDVIPGRGPVSIRLNNLKGAVLCYPEASADFPQSAEQKAMRTRDLLDVALKSPDAQLSQIILDPKNMKQIRRDLNLKDYVIKGEASVEKQEAEIEILLRSGPQPNPQKVKLKNILETAVQKMQAQLAMHHKTGIPPTPEEGQQFQEAQPMIAQIGQQLMAMPDMISTVKVRDDGSQDNAVEAAVCFDWMNSANGRKFANGNAEQQAAFANVHLHWQEEMTAAKKIAKENAPPPTPPKVSFSVPADKMPPPEQAAIVTAGGIPANPADFAQQQQVEANRKIQEKIVPDTAYAQAIHEK
jgi:hypothetical protein